MAARVQVIVLKNRLDDMGPEVQKRLGDAIKVAAMNIQAEAVVRSRVDTGTLKNSWRTDLPGPLVAIVASDQEHAIYNEYGTRYMSAQPMLRPAAQEELPKLARVLKQIVEEAAE